jgi:hypothetical protein
MQAQTDGSIFLPVSSVAMPTFPVLKLVPAYFAVVSAFLMLPLLKGCCILRAATSETTAGFFISAADQRWESSEAAHGRS